MEAFVKKLRFQVRLNNVDHIIVGGCCLKFCFIKCESVIDLLFLSADNSWGWIKLMNKFADISDG